MLFSLIGLDIEIATGKQFGFLMGDPVEGA